MNVYTYICITHVYITLHSLAHSRAPRKSSRKYFCYIVRICWPLDTRTYKIRQDIDSWWHRAVLQAVRFNKIPLYGFIRSCDWANTTDLRGKAKFTFARTSVHQRDDICGLDAHANTDSSGCNRAKLSTGSESRVVPEKIPSWSSRWSSPVVFARAWMSHGWKRERERTGISFTWRVTQFHIRARDTSPKSPFSLSFLSWPHFSFLSFVLADIAILYLQLKKKV